MPLFEQRSGVWALPVSLRERRPRLNYRTSTFNCAGGQDRLRARGTRSRHRRLPHEMRASVALVEIDRPPEGQFRG